MRVLCYHIFSHLHLVARFVVYLYTFDLYLGLVVTGWILLLLYLSVQCTGQNVKLI